MEHANKYNKKTHTYIHTYIYITLLQILYQDKLRTLIVSKHFIRHVLRYGEYLK